MAKRDSITAPRFTNETAARKHLEATRWPDGPVCPHCGSVDRASRLEAKEKGKGARPGLLFCNECREQFSVTIGTVMESSHIPLHKWLLAIHLMSASKKGISALQLQRMLGLGSYRSAWHLSHRIRLAMDEIAPAPIGGENKVVEADESFFGGKAKNRAYKKEPNKQAVLTLVERNGKSRSFHIANIKAKTLRETIVKVASRKSHLATDESPSYEKLGREFAGHSTVNHSANEYVRLGGFAHTNTAEGRFSLMKRAVFGTHHSISEAHLSRYLTEWDFKYNNRNVDDAERAQMALRGIEGRRLTYRRTDKAANA